MCWITAENGSTIYLVCDCPGEPLDIDGAALLTEEIGKHPQNVFSKLLLCQVRYLTIGICSGHIRSRPADYS